MRMFWFILGAVFLAFANVPIKAMSFVCVCLAAAFMMPLISKGE